MEGKKKKNNTRFKAFFETIIQISPSHGTIKNRDY